MWTARLRLEVKVKTELWVIGALLGLLVTVTVNGCWLAARIEALEVRLLPNH